MLTGYTFPGQNVSAQIDGGIYKFYIPKDGVISGLEMSVNENNFILQEGIMIICGRVIGSTGTTSVALTEIPSSGYAQIVLAIDTTQPSTTSTFEQVS